MENIDNRRRAYPENGGILKKILILLALAIPSVLFGQTNTDVVIRQNTNGTVSILPSEATTVIYEAMFPSNRPVLADSNGLVQSPTNFWSQNSSNVISSLNLGPFATATNISSTNISDFSSAVQAAAPPTTNASLLTGGTLPDARLSTNVIRSYVNEYDERRIDFTNGYIDVLAVWAQDVAAYGGLYFPGGYIVNDGSDNASISIDSEASKSNFRTAFGLQSWATNTNTPLFVSTNGVVTSTNAVTFPVLRTSEESVMLGDGASANNGGGAVGNGASADDGGGAVGNGVFANSGGGAVGNGAFADGGGGAVGNGASADGGGGAVGNGAFANGGGGAIGNGAGAGDGGFAGGNLAVADAFRSVQLGTGTNETDGTLQFRSFPLVDAGGKIPVERFPAWAASTNPGVVRTNLGMPWPGLTNTNAGSFWSALVGVGTNDMYFPRAIWVNEEGDLAKISSEGFYSDEFSGALNFEERYLKFLASSTNEFGIDYTKGLYFSNNPTAQANTRTNLGLGAGWLTNSNVPTPYSGAAPTGALLTADGAGGSAFEIGSSGVIYKTTNDETKDASTAGTWAAINSNNMTSFPAITLEANSIYRFDFAFFFIAGGTATTIMQTFNPSSSGIFMGVLDGGGLGMHTKNNGTMGNVGVNGAQVWFNQSAPQDIPTNKVTPNIGWCYFMTGTNSATVRYGWSQVGTNGTTTLKKGSFIKVSKD